MDVKEYQKKYRELNKEKRKEINKKHKLEYYYRNKDKIKKQRKKYREKNKEKIKEYRKKNKEKIKEYNKKYMKKKYNNNDNFRLSMLMRCRLNNYLRKKNIRKNDSSLSLIGLNPDKFREWIEYNLDLDNINDNEYHLDHINPLSLFKCLTYKDIKKNKVNHWTNIRPIPMMDNILKSNREPTYNEKLLTEIRVFIFRRDFL